MVKRVTVSDEAKVVIAQLKADFGELLFHQSGGCCDGSQPMCFPINEFKLGANDVCLGEIEGCKFWMNQDQFELWKFTQLHIHLTKGRGASFSIEIPLGVRFITQSRLFTATELQNLEPLIYVDE